MGNGPPNIVFINNRARTNTQFTCQQGQSSLQNINISTIIESDLIQIRLEHLFTV